MQNYENERVFHFAFFTENKRANLSFSLLISKSEFFFSTLLPTNNLFFFLFRSELMVTLKRMNDESEYPIQ